MRQNDIGIIIDKGRRNDYIIGKLLRNVWVGCPQRAAGLVLEEVEVCLEGYASKPMESEYLELVVIPLFLRLQSLGSRFIKSCWKYKRLFWITAERGFCFQNPYKCCCKCSDFLSFFLLLFLLLHLRLPLLKRTSFSPSILNTFNFLLFLKGYTSINLFYSYTSSFVLDILTII